MLNKYRAVGNKYGYYKIQYWRKPIKLFSFILLRGKWIDYYIYTAITCYCPLFTSIEAAQIKIDDILSDEKRLNNEWDYEEGGI